MCSSHSIADISFRRSVTLFLEFRQIEQFWTTTTRMSLWKLLYDLCLLYLLVLEAVFMKGMAF